MSFFSSFSSFSSHFNFVICTNVNLYVVHRANGDYLKAILCYKAEMRLKQQILGPDHLRVAIALIYLAGIPQI
jgi:hypothetical protein